MDTSYSTTSSHKKGKHLSFEDRVIIQLRIKDDFSIRAIAREIGCSPTTVSNEIKRGTVSLYHDKVQRYKASAGQSAYESNRNNSCRHYAVLEKSGFIEYVTRHFFDDGWSLDACYGRALEDGTFSKDEMVCTKTLYNYVELGLISIKGIDLPEKLKRNTKTHRNNVNKKVLGRSIEERPDSVETRKEFGHWECDLVLGSKKKEDDVLFTLLERKSRELLVIPIADKTAECVMNAINGLREIYSEHFDEVFKTITTDNGSEFATLSTIEDTVNTLVYYAHPYTSCEKGSIERHNGLIRRFIPKGKRIDQYSNQQIADIETWCNSLPRKILGYRTPDEIFEEELDIIYQQDAA